MNRDPSSNRWSLPQVWMDQNLWNTIIFVYLQGHEKLWIPMGNFRYLQGQPKAETPKPLRSVCHLDLHLVLALCIWWVEAPQTKVSRLAIRLALLAGKKYGPLQAGIIPPSYRGCEDWVMLKTSDLGLKTLCPSAIFGLPKQLACMLIMARNPNNSR